MGLHEEVSKLDGGREVIINDAITEFFNDEMTKIEDGTLILPKPSSVGVKIEMVSWDIQPISRQDGILGSVFLVGICKLDNAHYGAFWTPPTAELPKAMSYVEEIILTNGVINGDLTSISTTRPIYNLEEWTMISRFFNDNNIFEVNRIFEWTMNHMTADQLSAKMKDMDWFNRTQSRIKQLGRKPLSASEAAASMVGGMKIPFKK